MEIVTLIFIVVILVFSTVLHELAHGYVAYWLGDHTAKANGRLSLNPMVHIDPIMSIMIPVMLYIMKAPVFGGAKPVPINTKNLKWNEWGFALVAIAGPLTNIILSFLFFLVWYFCGGNVGEGNIILSYGVQINLGFALFNIIPIPPLDGSRVLYALAPDFARDFMRKIEPFGIFIVYIMVFFVGNWFAEYMIGAETSILRAYYWLVGVR
ncbi:site-2 protease family protein [Candidatus Saccharibacteria bacterium]|nr:site-2 protease family protein [Candidatus Saccharibacteria bacterium]